MGHITEERKEELLRRYGNANKSAGPGGMKPPGHGGRRPGGFGGPGRVP